MEHRRVCFCMLSLLPLVQISKLSQANSLLFSKVCCRTPRGVRGLKLSSDPAVDYCSGGRTPRGVRGLKSLSSIGVDAHKGRTPRGVRGLKYNESVGAEGEGVSHPSRGAWIEIVFRCLDKKPLLSHPSRGAWIEIAREVV